MTQNILCLAALGTLLLTGCNDSVTWVEQPNQSFKCDKEEIEDFEQSDSAKSNYSFLGEKTCSNAGKAEYAGKIRCKNDALQFACKGD